MLYTKALQNMEPNMPIYPFEVTFEEILLDPESYVDAVFSCLESEFLVMPKGAGFVESKVSTKRRISSYPVNSIRKLS